MMCCTFGCADKCQSDRQQPVSWVLLASWSTSVASQSYNKASITFNTKSCSAYFGMGQSDEDERSAKRWGSKQRNKWIKLICTKLTSRPDYARSHLAAGPPTCCAAAMMHHVDGASTLPRKRKDRKRKSMGFANLTVVWRFEVHAP